MFTRLVFTLLFTGSMALMWAQQSTGMNEDPHARTYTTQRTDKAPRINGLFDDEVWQNANWVGDFIQYAPENQAAPSQQTEFAILYDDVNLYIGIKAFDTEPEKIENRLTRRDENQGDLVVVHFDSYFDKRTAFAFAVSAAGVRNDGFIRNDDMNDFDETWDPIWLVRTQIHTEGWNAEMMIPLSQLRFNDQSKQTWGLQVGRGIFRNDEWSIWKHIPVDAAGWVSRYGEMDGLENIKPMKQIEIAPFIVGATEVYEKEEGNPFADGTDLKANTGVDGKIGITNDLILDFTINPDFGQVEADPSQVNLSAFEIFFRERRPFFIEGNNITHFQLTPGDSPWSRDNLFYSRRIGRRPHGDPELADGEFMKFPDNTRILGAFKLTGKTQKGWSIGIIESITNREKAIIDNNGNRRKEVVEPLSNYFVARVQKDINKGNTIIGGMITSTYRDIVNEDLLFLPKSAITGGIDFTQYFKNRTYFITASLATSQVSGDQWAIQELQESSRHFYQRPDSDYLTYDPSRTSLAGTGGTLLAGRLTNSGLRFLFNATWRSPGLELNDVGFMRSGDNVFQFIWAGYQINKPFSVFRWMSINVDQWSGFDFGANNLFKGGSVNFNTQFQNFWSIGFGANREGDGMSNTMLRGGPSILSNGSWNCFAFVSTNSRKKLVLEGGMFANFQDENLSQSKGFFGEINYRPFNSLSIEIEPEFRISRDQMQYVDQMTIGEGEDRYLFGTIDQKTFNVTIQVDYSITPDLSIQYYGSPFVSGGRYNDFKYITEPHADLAENRFHTYLSNEIIFHETFEEYEINEKPGSSSYFFGKPDFNFRQFRSNMVLRWEYVPGSILFLVWSQGKTDDVSDGTFNLRHDFKELFKTRGRDVFLLKFSYRFRAEQWRKGS
jgi:hypothetical protein